MPLKMMVRLSTVSALVLDRRVLEAELVFLRRPPHHSQLREPALLDPEVFDEVDAAAEDALDRLAADEDRGRRIPERPGDLDMVVLAGRPVGRQKGAGLS